MVNPEQLDKEINKAFAIKGVVQAPGFAPTGPGVNPNIQRLQSEDPQARLVSAGIIGAGLTGGALGAAGAAPVAAGTGFSLPPSVATGGTVAGGVGAGSFLGTTANRGRDVLLTGLLISQLDVLAWGFGISPEKDRERIMNINSQVTGTLIDFQRALESGDLDSARILLDSADRSLQEISTRVGSIQNWEAIGLQFNDVQTILNSQRARLETARAALGRAEEGFLTPRQAGNLREDLNIVERELQVLEARTKLPKEEKARKRALAKLFPTDADKIRSLEAQREEISRRLASGIEKDPLAQRIRERREGELTTATRENIIFRHPTGQPTTAAERTNRASIPSPRNFTPVPQTFTPTSQLFTPAPPEDLRKQSLPKKRRRSS